jgi:hypothetical protein
MVLKQGKASGTADFQKENGMEDMMLRIDERGFYWRKNNNIRL